MKINKISIDGKEESIEALDKIFGEFSYEYSFHKKIRFLENY